MGCPPVQGDLVHRPSGRPGLSAVHHHQERLCLRGAEGHREKGGSAPDCLHRSIRRDGRVHPEPARGWTGLARKAPRPRLASAAAWSAHYCPLALWAAAVPGKPPAALPTPSGLYSRLEPCLPSTVWCRGRFSHRSVLSSRATRSAPPATAALRAPHQRGDNRIGVGQSARPSGWRAPRFRAPSKHGLHPG